MVKLSLFFVSFIFSLAALAKADLSRYDLTDKQKALIARLEARGISDEEIEKFAAALHRSNHPQTPFIPPHTPELLDQVTAWAEGGAFSGFSKDAGIRFDREAYMADCPDLPLFGFGKATGTQYLKRDVLTLYYNAAYMMNMGLQKDPAAFKAFYLSKIKGTAFEKYIIGDLPK